MWGREAPPRVASLLHPAQPQLERLSSWSSPGSLRKPSDRGVEHRGPLKPWLLLVEAPAPPAERGQSTALCTRMQLQCGKKGQLLVLSWSIPRRRDGGKLLGLPPMTVKSRRVFSERLQGKQKTPMQSTDRLTKASCHKPGLIQEEETC